MRHALIYCKNINVSSNEVIHLSKMEIDIPHNFFLKCINESDFKGNNHDFL